MNKINLQKINQARERLLSHSVYNEMNTPERVKVFMKHHVFAVWDFMTLLKRLQNDLTNVTLPWVPSPHPAYARFINEIVLGEETDEDGEGGYISHFELYLLAMKEVGAETDLIEKYVEQMREGIHPLDALKSESIPLTVANFVRQTMETSFEGKVHEVASAFFFGREDIIPDMFQVLVQEMSNKQIFANKLDYYLQRHIELDGDEHGPLAERLLQSLCGDDLIKMKEAEGIAYRSLETRIQLWDGVLEEIKEIGL